MPLLLWTQALEHMVFENKRGDDIALLAQRAVDMMISSTKGIAVAWLHRGEMHHLE